MPDPCPTYRHQARKTPGALGAGVPLPAVVRLEDRARPRQGRFYWRCGLCAAGDLQFGLGHVTGEHAALDSAALERLGLDQLGAAGISTAPAPVTG